MLKYQTNSLGEEELYQLIGQNIFYYRLKEKLTLAMLSERIATDLPMTLSVAELQKIEDGYAILEIGPLLTIAEALRIEVDYLFQIRSFADFLKDYGKAQIEQHFLTNAESSTSFEHSSLTND